MDAGGGLGIEPGGLGTGRKVCMQVFLLDSGVKAAWRSILPAQYF